MYVSSYIRPSLKKLIALSYSLALVESSAISSQILARESKHCLIRITWRFFKVSSAKELYLWSRKETLASSFKWKLLCSTFLRYCLLYCATKKWFFVFSVDGAVIYFLFYHDVKSGLWMKSFIAAIHCWPELSCGFVFYIIWKNANTLLLLLLLLLIYFDLFWFIYWLILLFIPSFTNERH